jgi:PAS domain S-box-containing protein
MLRKNRYRTVVEDQTEVISRILPDGTFTFVNEVYCRIFGKPAEDLIGKVWHPVAHPDDLPMIEAKLREMSPDNPVVTIENRVYVASGELLWMQFVNRGFYDAERHLTEIQSVGRDITALKQTEAALKASEATLERAQAVARIGSFAMGSDTGQFTYTNETARLFDLDDRLECRFVEWFSRVHPDDQPAVEAAWNAALQGAPYDMTYRIVVRGQVIWIRGVAELDFDDQGHLLECVGTVQDVTDQKRTENALRESEGRLEMAMKGSGLALWDWDLATGSIHFSKRWYEMLGYPPEASPTHIDHWKRLFNPNDLIRVESLVAAYLAGESPFLQSEHRVRHKEGYWVTVEATGKITQLDATGHPLRIVGTVLDVSNKKRLNDEGIDLLKQIEALIRANSSNAAAQPADNAALASLTKRERQILGMIAEGMTSAQIAIQLQISANTIVTHRKNLMSKLDLHTTVEVTRFAMDHGLLKPKR